MRTEQIDTAQLREQDLNAMMQWFGLVEGVVDFLFTLGNTTPLNCEEGMDDFLFTLGNTTPLNCEEGVDDFLFTLGNTTPLNCEEGVDDFLFTLGNTTPLNCEEGVDDFLFTLGNTTPLNCEEGVDDFLFTLGNTTPLNCEEGVDDFLFTLGNTTPLNCEEGVDDFLFTLGNTTPLERLPSCQMNAPVLSDVPDDIQALMDSHPHELSLQESNVIAYIGGYVVRTIRYKVCLPCRQKISSVVYATSPNHDSCVRKPSVMRSWYFRSQFISKLLSIILWAISLNYTIIRSSILKFMISLCVSFVYHFGSYEIAD